MTDSSSPKRDSVPVPSGRPSWDPARHAWNPSGIELSNPSAAVRSGWIMLGSGIALAVTTGGVALTFGALPVFGLLLVPVVAFLVYGIFQIGGAERGPGERRLRAGSLTTEAGDVVVEVQGLTTVFPRASVKGGWLEPHDGCTAVLRVDDGRTIAADFASEQEASALLDAAGAGARRAAVRMPVFRESTSGRKTAGIVALLLLVFVVSSIVGAFAGTLFLAADAASPLALLPISALPMVIPFCVPLWWYGAKLWPSWVDVGTDGVIVRGLTSSEFLAYRDIQTIEVVFRVYHNVVLTLLNGREVKIPASSEPAADALVQRMEAARRAAPTEERSALLKAMMRQGRSWSEWACALRGLLEDHAYRSAAHGIHDLLAVLEDPGASPEQRVAAAIAMQPHADGNVKRRMRIAAAACVRPKLRVALERAAAGEAGEAELQLAAAPDEAGLGNRA